MRLKTILTACLLCAALTVPAAALTVEVDGRDRTSETGAVLIEHTTYVSLRAAAELLLPGAEIGWRQGTATVASPEIVLTARPGDGHIQVNGQRVELTGGVQLREDTVLVPLRTLCGALGGQVRWDDTRGAALVYTAEPPADAPELDETDEDLYWLSRIISAESRGEPLRGKLAVGTVVLNRVASDEFPDTIHDVIFDMRWGGQFEPVRNGTVYNEPTEESVLAARMCLQGAREAGESLYFLAPELTDNHWTMKNRTYVTTIGCHWFYK